jgi:hypothetical protein
MCGNLYGLQNLPRSQLAALFLWMFHQYIQEHLENLKVQIVINLYITDFIKAACLQIQAYFHENFENVFKSKISWSEPKKVINTLQTALLIQVKYQKEVKIYIKIFSCVSNAVEL